MIKFPIVNNYTNHQIMHVITCKNNTIIEDKEKPDYINTLINISNFSFVNSSKKRDDKHKIFKPLLYVNNLKVNKENLNIFIFLKKYDPQFMVYAGYVSPKILVNGVISFLIKNPKNGTEIIAKNILINSNKYGEEEGEKLTKSRQKKILNNWICYNVLNMNLHDWFLKEIVKIKKIKEVI
ncbi:hypothetical protein [Sodalis praecaptivus]|uniref:hypothetical protein n=1 Tax=Sodalis praecaptivus TaxID=1239307 RepID=UPI00046CE560|nr:hypothetical protein [Sodalis praecaptivus]